LLFFWLPAPNLQPNAEATYDALNKYGQDIVKLAEEGKLDPVIGRDAEIRSARAAPVNIF